MDISTSSYCGQWFTIEAKDGGAKIESDIHTKKEAIEFKSQLEDALFELNEFINS